MLAHGFWRIRFVIDRLRSRYYKQIVICGYPRGGTSLLYNMVSASLPGFYFDEFESRAAERIHRYGNYATKAPTDIFELNKLPALNIYKKEIFVLVVVRDIRDVITSKHPNIPDEFFIGYDHSWWPRKDSHAAWQYDGSGVLEIHAAIEQSAAIEGITVIKVSYEEMINDPDGLQKKLEKNMGINFDYPIRDFHRNKAKLAYKYDDYQQRKSSLVFEDKPITGSRAGKWRKPEFRARIQQQFGSCPSLFEILIKDGYETERSWFDGYKQD